jgi:hypothetical protein
MQREQHAAKAKKNWFHHEEQDDSNIISALPGLV